MCSRPGGSRGSGNFDFTDTTLDAFLEALPDQPDALRWSEELPVGTQWRPEKGALIGDPSDLGTGEPSDMDIDAVVELYDRWLAYQARLIELGEDPRYVGFTGSEDALILLFARDSTPDGIVEEFSGYGFPEWPGGVGVSEVRAAEIDLTLAQVQEIRDTLAEILAEHGLSTEQLQLTFSLDEKPEAYIQVSDPVVGRSIRQAVRDRLGKGAVHVWFDPPPVPQDGGLVEVDP